MPVARRSVTISGGLKLSYLEAGEGKPLVMLPGWSQSAAEFKHQLSALAEGRRVIALDLRGHGESDKPAGGYRISRLAADLREVLIALDLSDVDLLGHSMGCSVSWCYLDLFGAERLSRLILVDQAGEPPSSDTVSHDLGTIGVSPAADFRRLPPSERHAQAYKGTTKMSASRLVRPFSPSPCMLLRACFPDENAQARELSR